MNNDLIDRVIQQESGGNPYAVSPVGAAGLMQIMPATAADPGFGMSPLAWENVFDPTANRAFGEEYLNHLLNRYNGDQTRALAAYNWGLGNVDKWDGDLNSLPAETRNYVVSILGGQSSVPHTPQAAGQQPPISPYTALQEDKSPYTELGGLLASIPQAQHIQMSPIKNNYRPMMSGLLRV